MFYQARFGLIITYHGGQRQETFHSLASNYDFHHSSKPVTIDGRQFHNKIMLVPLDRIPDWRHPPLITILLILVNVLVFFVFQINDNQYEHEADNYYFSSDLPEIELPAYRDYLSDQTNPTNFPDVYYYIMDGEISPQTLHRVMEVDGPFMLKLRAEQVIRPDSPLYESWKYQRQEYERVKKRSTSYRFSLINIQPSVVTLFTHMFLHAGIGHLVGNMVFLFLFGFVVEMTLGRKLYLFAYLLSGLMSGLFYLALEPDSAYWGMGASGAIFGLAGMYTVLFGMRKIRFFYTLLFYFDYVKAPALIMLPVFLAYELFYQMYSEDNINNLAHIGGLLSGALIAWLAKRYAPSINVEYLDAEENKRAFEEKHAQALQALSAMDLGKARRLLGELLEEQPDNLDLMLKLYNVVKANPNDEDIHRCARCILQHPAADRATVKTQHEIFIDYVTRVQPNVRLGPEVMLSLALKFAANDYLEDAEKIVIHLTTRMSDFERNAEGLMALATHYRRKNNPAKARKYLAMLLECYPDSDEAKNARQAFA